jgi:hypothetical protein
MLAMALAGNLRRAILFDRQVNARFGCIPTEPVGFAEHGR